MSDLEMGKWKKNANYFTNRDKYKLFFNLVAVKIIMRKNYGKTVS